jgi:glycosyltransferase involved in cell wall biosynthesis
MRVLVWQWGRRGGGPRYALELAGGLAALSGVETMLSLSAQSEILGGGGAPACQLPFPTYEDLAGLVVRLPALPFQVAPLAARVSALRPDVAICAMPAALDLLMAAALRRVGVPFFVVVHDADPHPGDGFPLQMALQRMLVRRAHGLVALTGHVAERLRQQSLVRGRPLIIVPHPPRVFGPLPPPPRAHGGKLRLLSFGRLLPYKGLDLLADALRLLGPRADMEVRVVGSGPESGELDTLRRIPGVTVENRWVPEAEVGEVIAWADALVLSHREASQSGAAAAAIAAGRWMVATRVGGIAEQLRDQPLARLCEPTAEGLVRELRLLVERPPMPPAAMPDDPRAAWRAAAAELAHQLSATLGRAVPSVDQPGLAKRPKEATSTS